MKTLTNNYVSNRVLKLNVGFLLTAGSGHNHITTFDAPAVRIADDTYVDYIRGPVRMSRTKEGILVQGELQVAIEQECDRCLNPIASTYNIEIEELYSYPASDSAEFGIGEDAILDLAPLLRDEMLILESHAKLCQEDCKGLCLECGENLNEVSCDCGLENIDPRLAQLKELLNRK